MSSPSLAARADTTVVETHTTSVRRPETVVVSVRTDDQGAREAARWAEKVQGAGATALVSTDAQLETQIDTASRVLVLDPGMIASWRGFGARGTSRDRLQLVARLAGRSAHVTWASTGTQAEEWVHAAA